MQETKEMRREALEALRKAEMCASKHARQDMENKSVWRGKVPVPKRVAVEEVKRCWCGKPAFRMVNASPNVNFGRGFFKCKQEGEGCDFWQWDEMHPWDELEASLPLETKSYLTTVRHEMFKAANSQDYITAGRIQEHLEMIHVQLISE